MTRRVSTAADVRVLRAPLRDLPSPLPIPTPPRRRGYVRLVPPGSKSLTNRALLLAALAPGASLIRRAVSDADDAVVMLDALRRLGAGVEVRTDGSIAVGGVAGRWKVPPEGVQLDLRNAGTATRFLAGAALLSSGPVTLDGNARMRERPIAELGDVLTRLGAGVRYAGSPGCPPLTITPPGAPAPGQSLEIPTTQSSQFISALLLVAPWLPGGLTLRLRGDVTSAAYVGMTLGLLAQLGADVRSSDDLRVIRVAGREGGLAPFELDVEPDASGATYWWAAGAMLPGLTARVAGIGTDSLQGDAQFPELLGRMGATVLREDGPDRSIAVVGPDTLRPVLADMRDMPDAAMTLASVACLAPGTSILRGLRTLRVKECDRIEAMRRELSKLGVRVENPVQGDPDALTITPPAGGIDLGPDAPPVELETYDDHRMAMSLALVGLRRPNVWIKNPACVNKTYPGFWADLAKLYAKG